MARLGWALRSQAPSGTQAHTARMSPLPRTLAVLSSFALLSPASAATLEQMKAESGTPFLEVSARGAVADPQAARSAIKASQGSRAVATQAPAKKRLDGDEPPVPSTAVDCIGRLTPRYSMVTTPLGGTLGLIVGGAIAYVGKSPAALGNGISIGMVLGQSAAAGLAARTCAMD